MSLTDQKILKAPTESLGDRFPWTTSLGGDRLISLNSIGRKRPTQTEMPAIDSLSESLAQERKVP
ncbi:MAG: hypothetical protein CBB71_13080 [Rhodopirellula sp. TMED11]|nr:MAG: hypothetical protein CBB71_13080 [Rhodopirellula sp. TMED11]